MHQESVPIVFQAITYVEKSIVFISVCKTLYLMMQK